MLKSLLTGLFFIYFLAGNAYAEDYNDIFWGMLKKRKSGDCFCPLRQSVIKNENSQNRRC